MDIEQHGSAEVVVASIRSQRIDAAAAGDFKRAIWDLLETGPASVVLDLSEVTFIDSTGLGAIVGLLRHPRRLRALVIAGACAQVQVLFRLTRMDRVFRMFATAQDALAALAQR
jgi:anti-sigma B factor antagonist